MKTVNLTINSVCETHQLLDAKFYLKGFDVNESLTSDSTYRLFLSNNKNELEAINHGNVRQGISPFYIDIKRDPLSEGFYIPESKKLCPKFNFYLLQRIASGPTAVPEAVIKIEHK